ncbi:site-specific integrase [Komagataeibacter xylinus]|uniref:site-specific integrase n=1 Tax=Komagataeibacter xylinus TaxID=28448 RepID=UPI00280C1370|nr:site-specific integrase [Komagataeibacter xylinus]
MSPSQTPPKVSSFPDASITNPRLIAYIRERGLRTNEELAYALMDDYRDMLAQQKLIQKASVEAAEMAGKAQYYKSVLNHARDVKHYQENLEEVIAIALKQQTELTALAYQAVQETRTTQAEKKILETEIRRLHDTLVSTLTKAIESTTARSAPVIPAPQPEATPSETPGTVPATPPSKTKPPVLLSAALKRFLNSKPAKSPETQRATSRTVTLFMDAFGDLPLCQIDGEVAGNFRDVLFSLPASHGKNRTLSLQEEIDRAASQDLPTLSAKTVKNHFMCASSLWGDLVRRNMAKENPWRGWDFNLSKRTPRRAWTQEEMNKLARTPWPACSIPAEIFMGITMVAAYSGMRLGEICNLRNEDIQDVEGFPCFRICAHPEDNWSPKTEAGERLVPIHSALRDWGLLTFRKAEEKYLFPDLKASQDGSRGADFSRAFSRYKMMMGLPPAVTFHGFRHTVSTLLRNQDSDIRELWIDALLGHESSHKSQGATTYLSGIDLTNLQRTVEAIQYPGFSLPSPGGHI